MKSDRCDGNNDFLDTPLPQNIFSFFNQLTKLNTFSENLLAQKKEMLSLYNFSISSWVQLYDFKNNCETQLDMVKLDEIIEKPMLLNNYYWVDPCAGSIGLEYPIEVACWEGWKEMVLHLIDKKHLFPIAKSHAICNAAEKNQHEIVQYLIQSGVSVTECALGRPPIKFGYDGSITLNNSEPLMSPLYYAISGNAVESAKLLIQEGATLEDLCFVHPADKNHNKDKQKTVRECIDSNKFLNLSNAMKQMLIEQDLHRNNAPRMK